jgi:alkylhydroperoxidase family enzyme
MNVAQPRIAPGTNADIGRVNAVIVGVIARVSGGDPLNVFTTLARHRTLFRGWLMFAGRLMPRGKLLRIDTELLILRTAHNCGCEYEWHHHVRIGALAGLTADQVERVRDGADGGGWTAREALLLRAADELHNDRVVSDPVWEELREHLSEVELIELCMLVGHYEMLAMTINSLRVQPDPIPSGQPSRLLRRFT